MAKKSLPQKKRKINPSSIKLFGPAPRSISTLVAIFSVGTVAGIFAAIGMRELKSSSALTAGTEYDIANSSPSSMMPASKILLVAILVAVGLTFLIAYYRFRNR